MSFRLFLIYIVLLLFFPLVAPPPTMAAASNSTHGSVRINEVAWMGTAKSHLCEWIEIYNNSDDTVNLNGWKIYEQGGATLLFELTGMVNAYEHYLVERATNSCSDAVPDVSSDDAGTFGGGLKNAGEHLVLTSAADITVDEINAENGWPAGDNDMNRTMEWTGTAWATSINPGGTPKARNSTATDAPPVPDPESESKSKPKQEPEQKKEPIPMAEPPPVAPRTEYPSGVVIAELMPSPSGPDAEQEWIELHNTTTSTINIGNWFLRDGKGAPHAYMIPSGTLLPPKSYRVFSRPSTRIVLNNDTDVVELLHPDKIVTATLSYTNAPTNQALALRDTADPSSATWTTTPTPGSANVVTQPLPPKETQKEVAQSSTTTTSDEFPRSSESRESKVSAAVLSSLPPSPPRPLVRMFVGLFVAIGIALTLTIVEWKQKMGDEG